MQTSEALLQIDLPHPMLVRALEGVDQVQLSDGEAEQVDRAGRRRR